MFHEDLRNCSTSSSKFKVSFSELTGMSGVFFERNFSMERDPCQYKVDNCKTAMSVLG